MQDEVWKDIPGYEGLYQVSNLGKVKSLNKYHHKREQILKSRITKYGYYETALCKNGKMKFIGTHRLVALAFIPNLLNKEQINHKDGNKLNNFVDNLEWCTSLENIHHAIRTGLEKVYGHENYNAKEVRQLDLDGNFIKKYKCLKYAQQETGIKYTDISLVCHGKRKTAGGYKWEFVVKEV